jgi:hypothetical protein
MEVKSMDYQKQIDLASKWAGSAGFKESILRLQEQADACANCDPENCTGLRLIVDKRASDTCGRLILCSEPCTVYDEDAMSNRLNRSGLPSQLPDEPEAKLQRIAKNTPLNVSLFENCTTRIVARDRRLVLDFVWCWIAVLLASGDECRYAISPRLFRSVGEIRLDWVLADPDLLVLDRYDAGMAGGWVFAKLFEHLQYRVDHCKTTLIITSQRSLSERKPEEHELVELISELEVVEVDEPTNSSPSFDAGTSIWG